MVDEMKLGYSRKQIAECYMAIGGIPYYWSFLQKGLSVQQNMDQLFFAEDAGLKTEYIDKGYAKSLANKQQALRTVTGTKKGIHLTFVTVDGVAHNSYWNDVQSEVTLDDLFK